MRGCECVESVSLLRCEVSLSSTCSTSLHVFGNPGVHLITRPRSRIGLAFLLILVAGVSPASAASIVAGTTVLPGEAIQDITLLPNTALNPGLTSLPIIIQDVTGFASITIDRDAQVGTTIQIASLSGGQFHGSNASLGNYVFGNIPPLTGADFSGAITNVVQNPSDPGFATGQPSSFQSGNFSFGGASFGFELLGVRDPSDVVHRSDGPVQFLRHVGRLTTLGGHGPDELRI